MPTLIMSSRHTADDQALWRVAVGLGWPVVRARGIRVPPTDDSELAIYVEALYGPEIAAQLGCELLDPPVDWLCRVPTQFLQRDVQLVTLEVARQMVGPAFFKPPNDKSFPAQVYQSGAHLPTEFAGELPVLVAKPVEFQAEFRCFCLNGKVRTLSPYLRSGVLAKHTDFAATEMELASAKVFAEQVLAATTDFTPTAIVLDVGEIPAKGWAVVEANGAWGAGLYGCDPAEALQVIRYATRRLTP